MRALLRPLLSVMAAATLAVAATAAPSIASELSDSAGGDHCLASTERVADSNELKIVSIECFDTIGEVYAELGAPVPAELSDDTTRASGTEQRDGYQAPASGDFALGTHFDFATFSGPSITVSGSDCYGGFVNLPAPWDNRISSTLNGCPTVQHWDIWYRLGQSEFTTGFGGVLTTMDNRTSSIAYLS